MTKKTIAMILASMLIAFSFASCKPKENVEPSNPESVSASDSSEQSSEPEDESPVSKEAIAKYDALIEEEYAEDLKKVDATREYKYTSTRQANRLIKSSDRYYITIDEYDPDNSLFKACVYCYNSTDDSLLWQKEYGSNNITSFADSALLSDGSLVVCGSSSSTKGRFEGIKNDRDNTAVLVRLSKEGEEMWLTTWDDADHESFSRVDVTENDDIIVSATSQSDDETHAEVKCYNKDGKEKWSNIMDKDIKSAPGLVVVNNEKKEFTIVGIFDDSMSLTHYYLSRYDFDGKQIGERLDIGAYNEISLASLCYLPNNQAVLSGRWYDESYDLGKSVVSHEEEHEGTADITYNRYGPGYVFAIDLDTGDIVWEYKSYGYLGGSVSYVWLNGDTVYALGTRFAAQIETPGGASLGGDSVLYKLTQKGELISREVISGSTVEENEETFMTAYRPDGDGFISITEVWPEQ